MSDVRCQSWRKDLRKPSNRCSITDHHGDVNADVVGVRHQHRVTSYDDDCARNGKYGKRDCCSVGCESTDNDEHDCQNRHGDIEDLGRRDVAEAHVGDDSRLVEFDATASTGHASPAEGEEP